MGFLFNHPILLSQPQPLFILSLSLCLQNDLTKHVQHAHKLVYNNMKCISIVSAVILIAAAAVQAAPFPGGVADVSDVKTDVRVPVKVKGEDIHILRRSDALVNAHDINTKAEVPVDVNLKDVNVAKGLLGKRGGIVDVSDVKTDVRVPVKVKGEDIHILRRSDALVNAHDINTKAKVPVDVNLKNVKVAQGLLG